MDFTVQLSSTFNLSPFDIMEQDKDYVIMMINYYIEKSESGEIITEEKNARIKPHKNSSGRIRVNDKTATGGWF